MRVVSDLCTIFILVEQDSFEPECLQVTTLQSREKKPVPAHVPCGVGKIYLLYVFLFYNLINKKPEEIYALSQILDRGRILIDRCWVQLIVLTSWKEFSPLSFQFFGQFCYQ